MMIISTHFAIITTSKFVSLESLAIEAIALFTSHECTIAFARCCDDTKTLASEVTEATTTMDLPGVAIHVVVGIPEEDFPESRKQVPTKKYILKKTRQKKGGNSVEARIKMKQPRNMGRTFLEAMARSQGGQMGNNLRPYSMICIDKDLYILY